MTAFREEAALRLYAVDGIDDVEDAVRLAQSLADEACRQWGHQERPGEYLAISCYRCGKPIPRNLPKSEAYQLMADTARAMSVMGRKAEVSRTTPVCMSKETMEELHALADEWDKEALRE